MFFNFMTFQFSFLDNFWLISILIFFWEGDPLRAPRKKCKTPMIPFSTKLLLKNILYLWLNSYIDKPYYALKQPYI